MHPSQHTSSSRNLEDTLKSQTSHLFLNKTIAQKGSSISINELVPPPTPSAGIRAHIGHLLPRHANFRARIQIHQISSVPFVSGEFGVRWKFKAVQSSSGPKAPKKGLLGRTKSKSKNTKNPKAKERELDSELLPADALYLVTPISNIKVADELPAPADSSISLASSAHTSSHVSSSKSSLTVHSRPAPHQANSSSSSHMFNFPSANASHVTMVPESMVTDLANPSTSISTFIPTHRRGSTPFLKLKEHAVVWSHTLDTLLKFDIDRETYQIHPNPLKLVVMQRIIPDDPSGSPQNPRLGAVYLNLAEYIGKGSVERKHLLKESKINAVLKLTVELEYVSGEATYIPPPLPKGEILNEITGFLDDEIVRRRPRALNLFGPYRDQEELEMDLMTPARSGRFPKSSRSLGGFIRNVTTTPIESGSEGEPSDIDDLDGVDVAFDVQRLPHAYGTKTTETIIEALFNPVKISDKKYETPFTIYEPRTPAKKSTTGIGLGLSGAVVDRDATISKRQNSLTQDNTSSFYHYSTGSSSTSLHTSTTSSSKEKSKESGRHRLPESQPGTAVPQKISGVNVGESVEDLTATATFGGVRGWWKRHTKRPEMPTTARV